MDYWLFIISFNTQPPEGGWQPAMKKTNTVTGFNTQPPEGGWIAYCVKCNIL